MEVTAKPASARRRSDMLASQHPFVQLYCAPPEKFGTETRRPKVNHMKRGLHSIGSYGDAVLLRCRPSPSSWTRGLGRHQLDRQSATLRKTNKSPPSADSCVDSAPLWPAKVDVPELAAARLSKGKGQRKMRQMLMLLSQQCLENAVMFA
jgi:hypothetical protein